MLRSLTALSLCALAGCNAIAGWDDIDTGSKPPTATTTGVQVSPSAAPAADPVAITDSALGTEHGCAILGSGADATAACWGRNTAGRLGTGDTVDHLLPAPVAGLRGVDTISSGALHTCAIDTEGKVYCWGTNMYGALGRGATDADAHPVPEHVANVDRGSILALGMNFTCVLTASGDVACWGTNTAGQLGVGSSEPWYVPQVIQSIDTVSAITAGSEHVCAIGEDLLANAGVYCWGSNQHGQIGRELSVRSRNEPTRVVGVDNAVDVTAGDAHTCARRGDGSAVCWGQNDVGQLGVAGGTDTSTPQVVPLAGVTSIAAGAKHTCALHNKELWCWGSNAQGQLGVDPGVTAGSAKPMRVTVPNVLDQVDAVFASGYQTCALRPDHTLVCWGSNDAGQLGIGVKSPSSAPASVAFGKQEGK